VIQPVILQIDTGIALVEIDYPPVNALSHAVRTGLQDCVARARADDTVRAIVICGTGRTFVAGADIREFGQTPREPFLPDLINQIEATPVPVVAALHGTVLGGGLELAMGAHYRVALDGTAFGLPEVKLGLLPGAGGTQRLPRLIPAAKALAMITTGTPIKSAEALTLGLIDHVDTGTDARAAGIAFARDLVAQAKPVRMTSAMPCTPVDSDTLDATRAKLAKSARGQIAPQSCVDAVQGAIDLPFAEGLAQERALFRDLLDSNQRAAMIHAFFAERQVGKLPELTGVTSRDVAFVGVVGGGTMGAGIATSCLLAGLNVTLIERDQDTANRARTTVAALLAGAVKRGKLAQETHDTILAERFATQTDYSALSQADLVVEAVFESAEVKRDVFTQLDAVCKPGAILASNTSYLDVNDIAAMTTRPGDVVGLHFFSPAHVMKLLEVVVADETTPDVIATGFALAKRLGKVAVRSGVCEGFIGNRLLTQYRKAADGAVLAGASPFAVDRAMVSFGLAMGPYAVSDLAGLDIGWATRKRLAPMRDPREVYATFSDQLCELGRFGRKTGRGFYLHDGGKSTPDPEVEDIVAADRAAKGITPREVSDQEIVDRYMAAMVNEAARVVEEGIALRPLDVDVTLLNGYGFPRWRGGPMHYADTVGLDKVLSDIEKFALEDDFLWQPAPLLKRLIAEGRTFADLNS